MNKFFNVSVCVTALFACIAVVSSCENKGPKGEVVFPERGTEELVRETIEAVENSGYVYKFSVELHYLDGSSWKSAGHHGVFNFPNGQSECNDWVLFGNSARDLMPVYYTDKGGYTFRTKYMGVDYYY